jgi:hypothetical protein
MRFLFCLLSTCFSIIGIDAQVGIGTTSPNSSAQLDVNSINKGFLPPRMTQAQRDVIVNPSPGLIIFNTTTGHLEFFSGQGWGAVTFSQPNIKRLLGGNVEDVPYTGIQTVDGGYIIAGSSQSSNTGDLTGATNNGSDDAWIVKLNATGAIQWHRLLGGLASDIARSIQQTTDGGYIVAGNSSSSNTGTLTGITNNGQSDGWLIKLDGNGNVQWQKLFGGVIFDALSDIKVTFDGGYIICGNALSSNNGTLAGITNNGAGDCWILRLDNGGNLQWQRLYGGNQIDNSLSIQITTDYGFIVAGYSLSSNTGTLAGYINNGTSDGWIMKLDSSGNVQWQRLMGGTTDETLNSVQQTTDNGYIVTGSSASSFGGFINNGGLDGWILKLDNSGTIQWQKLLGGSAFDQLFNIQLTSEGRYIVAGQSQSSNSGTLTGLTNNGGADYWILKFDEFGILQWQKLLGGSTHDEARSINLTADGVFIVTGYSLSSNTGNLTGLNNNGGRDYWILKLDRYGNPF